MKTAMLELPAVLVHAIQDVAFTDKPLWRIGEGLQHVEVELTFKLPTNQPTNMYWQRKEAYNVQGGRKQEEKACTPPPPGEWLRHSLPAKKPPTTNQPALRQTAPPPTVTIISPTTPTLNYQRPETTRPSPTLPPPKKLPRHEPPAQTRTNKAYPAPPTTSTSQNRRPPTHRNDNDCTSPDKPTWKLGSSTASMLSDSSGQGPNDASSAYSDID